MSITYTMAVTPAMMRRYEMMSKYYQLIINQFMDLHPKQCKYHKPYVKNPICPICNIYDGDIHDGKICLICDTKFMTKAEILNKLCSHCYPL